MGLAQRVREARWERQRRSPPRRPRGWSIAPPDFVGVGSEKAGTSWWYRLLTSHPNISHRGRPKEVRYFHRFADRAMGAEDAAAYARWFPRPSGQLAGEWTPSYMSLPSFSEQLRDAAPDARLLVILRDPVERIRSALTVRVARWGPEAARPPAWMIERSRYPSQIERLLAHFSAASLLVLQYERCVAEPAVELARTYRFLGVDDGHQPWLLHHRVNATAGEKVPLHPDDERALREIYEPEVDRLSELVPDVDVSLWPSFRNLA